MFALVESGSITKMLNGNKGITLNDLQYPRAIYTLWTEAERNAIGIYSIVYDDTNKKDERWYINTNQSFAFADNKVTATYGSATAKAHADTNFTAQEETDGLGTEGDVASRGLKYNYKTTINQKAAGVLQDTDWMVVRAAEGGTAVPSAITTWRAAVRTKANAMQVQIDGAADVDALAALYAYTYADPDDLTSALTRPLGEFPVLGA